MAKAKTTKKTSARAPKKAPKSRAVVSMLIDASGSMLSMVPITISSFNRYLSEIRETLDGHEVYFSSMLFSSSYDGGIRKLQAGVALTEARQLTAEEYMVGGGTPLVDAAIETIYATEAVCEKYGADKIVVVIQTDGEENMSKRGREELRSLIARKQALGWSFMFLGAGIDAFSAASQYGIPQSSTLAYNGIATGASFSAMTRSMGSYLSGSSATLNFTAEDRAKSMGVSQPPNGNTIVSDPAAKA